MQKNSDLKKKYIRQAKGIFKNNLIEGYAEWKKTHYRFIAPAKEEYVFQFLWDTAFHAIVLSHFDLNWAKSEIKNHLKAQWDNGFIPHIIFWGGSYLKLPHWAFIESKLPGRPRTTSLTQPPVLAIAAEIIYEKDHDQKFLNEILEKLAKHHRWLLKNRDNDKDFLISIISPNESGMDELPVFQTVAGYKGTATAKLHYYYRKGDLLNQGNGFDNKIILEKDYFNVEELLFNTVFIESNRALSRLFKEVGNISEAKYFTEIADNGEKSLLKKCWDDKDKIFYSLYTNSEKKAKVKTIASLIPLYLDGLKSPHLNDLISKHLLNPEEFFRPYPFPSVAASEIYYEPTEIPFYKIKLLWRGPTWMATNWFLVKGLRKHGQNKIADQVVEKMVEMIEKWGFREYYNPETGQGYRRENFGWSTLIIDLL